MVGIITHYRLYGPYPQQWRYLASQLVCFDNGIYLYVRISLWRIHMAKLFFQKFYSSRVRHVLSYTTDLYSTRSSLSTAKTPPKYSKFRRKMNKICQKTPPCHIYITADISNLVFCGSSCLMKLVKRYQYEPNRLTTTLSLFRDFAWFSRGITLKCFIFGKF